MYEFCVDATVSFNQSSYSINENNGPVQIVVVLSNPSSSDITIQVLNTDESATSKKHVISDYTLHVANSCNTGMNTLPDMYAQCLRDHLWY